MINTNNYSKYHKIECYNNTDELIFEAVLIKHTDFDTKTLVDFMKPMYHRVRLTTSQIVQTDES